MSARRFSAVPCKYGHLGGRYATGDCVVCAIARSKAKHAATRRLPTPDLPGLPARPRPLRLANPVKREHTLQAEVAHALRILLPREAFVTAVDHAHKKDALTGAILKGRGAVSGLPDLWLIWQGRIYCIELKREGGTVTATQQACHDLLRRAEARIAVCHSLDEVLDALHGWGIPTRVHRERAA